MDFGSILRMLEKNPEAKAQLEKSLGREMSALPAGKGAIELPGHVGVQETGAIGQGTSPEEMKMLNPGQGNSTPIELPAAQLEETGAMGQGAPEASPATSDSSLGDSIPSEQSPSASLSADTEASAPSMVTDQGNLGETIPQTVTETPEANQYSGDPIATDIAAEKSGMSLGKKAAIGAAGLGVGLGAYELTQGNDASAKIPPTAAPVVPPTTPNDLSQLADITGRGGAPSTGGVPTPTPHGVTPNVTNKHLQDALNFGSSQEQAAALQEVKNRQTMAELANGLGRAGSIIGSGIAKAPISKEGLAAFDEQGKQAGTITSDYLANQENDPKSAQSLALRNVLDKLGVKYTGEPTAAQLKQALPYIFKDQEAKQSQANQADLKKYQWALLAQRQKELKANKDALQDYKQRKDDESEVGKMGKELNSLSASSRSVIGQAAKAKLQAERMTQILNSAENPNPQDYESAVIDLNGALGGPNTEGSLHGLQYDNLKRKWAVFQQKYGSGIAGVNQPEVKAHMLQLANEMKAISNHTIEKNSHIVKAAHPELLRRHPEAFDNLISEMNWEPEAPAATGSLPSSGAPAPSPSPGASTPPSTGGPLKPSWAL